MGRRRPGVLDHPDERSIIKTRSLQSSLGTLRCYWSSMVISYEDNLRQMKRGMKILWIVSLIFFIIPIGVTFVIVTVEYKMSWIGVVAGLPVSLIMSGLILGWGSYEFHRRKDRNFHLKVFSAWRKVGRDRALLSVKQFMKQYDKNYTVKESTTSEGERGPEAIYKFQNGLELKARYTDTERGPIGWLMILYTFDQFEEALELQVSIDDYMDKREILKRRGAF